MARLPGTGRLAAAACLWVAVSAIVPAAAAAQGRQREVLALYGVRRDAQIAVVGDRDFPRWLEEGLSGGVDYYSEFVDAARFPEPGYREAFKDFLDLKYAHRRFDLLIAVGDLPLSFIEPYRDELFGTTPIVFYSSSATPRRLAGSTGITSAFDFARTVDLALALQPDLRQLFVVSGGANSELETARRQFARFSQRPAITYLVDLPTAALDAQLASLPERSAVYYLVLDRDGAQANFHPLQYLDRVVAVANAPVYCWVDSAFGRGIVGGSLKDQALEVRMLSDLALRVLRGESADAIPVAAVDLQVAQVDWRQVRRWGLDVSRLPAGVAVAFREPTPWDRYRPYIVGIAAALVAQTVLIAALLVQRTKRRRAESREREGYERIRHLGARLLDAQDRERARIARELHDDIGQQMALLEIDAELLRRAPDGQATALADELLGRAQSVARSVHDLSHRLHPAKLRLIGLVPALQGLQRELSQGGLPISFVHDDIPAGVSQEVTVCLFRIAQEALQNAIKHGNATEVAMSLRSADGRLVMTVADDGVGFNAGQVWGRGLGLISMRERAEAAHGTFEIRSTPDEGTVVRVTMPGV